MSNDNTLVEDHVIVSDPYGLETYLNRCQMFRGMKAYHHWKYIGAKSRVLDLLTNLFNKLVTKFETHLRSQCPNLWYLSSVAGCKHSEQLVLNVLTNVPTPLVHHIDTCKVAQMNPTSLQCLSFCHTVLQESKRLRNWPFHFLLPVYSNLLFFHFPVNLIASRES